MTLKVENLTKFFGINRVLNNISFELQKGSILSIIGPSGSGKSTLLRCINNFESPFQGKIYVDGIDNSVKGFDKIVAKIGMVFQNFNLFPHMNVLQNLIYGPVKVNKMPYDQAVEKAKFKLSQVGLIDKIDFMPKNLSGGQKQKVAIARCLMMDPEMILFDEPTSALDPESVKDVVNIIEKLKQENITMIIVTHQINLAKRLADYILFLSAGSLLEFSKKEAFFSKPESVQAQNFLQELYELI